MNVCFNFILHLGYCVLIMGFYFFSINVSKVFVQPYWNLRIMNAPIATRKDRHQVHLYRIDFFGILWIHLKTKLDTINRGSKRVSFQSNQRKCLVVIFYSKFHRNSTTGCHTIASWSSWKWIKCATIIRNGGHNDNARRCPCSFIECKRCKSRFVGKCGRTDTFGRRESIECRIRGEKYMRHATNRNTAWGIRFRRQHNCHCAAAAATKQCFPRWVERQASEWTSPTSRSTARHGNASEKSTFTSCKWITALTTMSRLKIW